MKKQQSHILCTGEGCPLKEQCAFFCETMTKSKTDHWGVIPYNHEKKKCSWFQEKEHDTPLLPYKPNL